MAQTAIFDVDGTLVDTDYQHALAWYRSFLRFDIVLPVWRIHRAIGMGGDQLVASLTGRGLADLLRCARETPSIRPGPPDPAQRRS